MDRYFVPALTGGFLAILVFIHFFVDWIFQSHAEAMVKHNNWKIRAKHCAIYTAPFVLFLYWIGFSWLQLSIAASILFFSHFMEDTYLPVLLWAKYIRRPPEMQWKIANECLVKPNGSVFRVVDGLTKDEIDNPLPFMWRKAILTGLVNKKLTQRQAQHALDHGGFLEFIDTTMGKILMISVDQIIHITFLLPIALMIVYI